MTLNFGQKAKQIRTNAYVNEIVQESPEQIASKINEMTLQIDELKDKLEEKQAIIDEFGEQTSELTSLGLLRATLDEINSQIDDKA